MGKTFSAFAALPIVRHYAVDDSSWSICACVFLLEVQYSILKSLISTCVLSYVGSREDGYLTESASLERTAGIVSDVLVIPTNW